MAQTKQSADALNALRVCATFEKSLSKDLDFEAAYEATFVKDVSRRRAIAVKDGEFGTDLTSIDDATVIRAYKQRMQLIYLMLPLAGPDSNQQEALFFPPVIKAIFERKPPQEPAQFRDYVVQLEHDVATMRSHLNKLQTDYPLVSERVRKFKEEVLSTNFDPPSNRSIEPLKEPYEGRVIRKNEPHYELNGYTVIKEGTEMRIAGIRFFTRLF